MKKKTLLQIFILLAVSMTLTACGTRVMPSSWPGIIVNGDTVYVAYNNQVFAIEMDDGDEIWRFPEEPDRSLTFFAAPTPTEDGQLLVGAYNNVFFSLDADNGGENWRNEEVHNYWIASPLVIEGLAYAPNADQTLYTFDLQGNQTAIFSADDPLWATPVTDGENLYLASMDHVLYALPIGGHDPVWVLALNGAMVSPPALSQKGVLYVGTLGNEVVAVDSQSGKKLWQASTQEWVWASPSVGDGAVYAADVSGKLYSLDAETGRELWSLETGASITGAPLFHEGTIYVCTEGGEVLAVDPNGKRVWTEDITGRLLGPPVAAGELILFGVVPDNSDGIVVALDLNGNQQWVFTPDD